MQARVPRTKIDKMSSTGTEREETRDKNFKMVVIEKETRDKNSKTAKEQIRKP